MHQPLTVAAPKLAIISKFSAFGGVSRMMVNLANALSEQNVRVDLLLATGETPHPAGISSQVRVIDLKSRHVYGAFFPLLRYLRREKPDALLAIRHRAITISCLAHMLAGNRKARRLAIRMAGHVSTSISGKSAFMRWLHLFPIRHLYPLVDTLIAVSSDVATDLSSVSGIDTQRIQVVPNPAIPPDLMTRAQRDAGHPWLDHKDLPVILGAGRFTPRKDFATLIKAFALLHEKRPCRLVLIGDGREKELYSRLARDLDLTSDVSLPGFVDNPYAFMARADLLVLSSTGAEGSPNVLKEAMALGLPVVSTDCPSGPREILQNGKLGPLVPIGDHRAMAEAMEKTLDAPPEPSILQEAVSPYSIAESSKAYMHVLGLQDHRPETAR